MANLPQGPSTADPYLVVRIQPHPWNANPIFHPPSSRRAIGTAKVPLFRNGNPWRDVRHVMTPLAERVARMQPAHFSGPFRLLELPTEMVVEIGRHLPPTALFALAQACTASRSTIFSDPTLRSTKLTSLDLWDLTRMRERDYDFADNQDVPCGYCLDIHPAVERPFRCPGMTMTNGVLIKAPVGLIRIRILGERDGLFPNWPAPSMVRYLAKVVLFVSKKHDNPSWVEELVSNMRKLEKDSYLLTGTPPDAYAMEAHSKLRFIGNRLLMRSKILIAKIPISSTRKKVPNRGPEKPSDFTKWATWNDVPYWRIMSQPCVCLHFTDNIHNLRRSEPLTRPPPVPTPGLQSRFSLSEATSEGPQPQEETGTSGTSAHDQHPELGECDGSVFSCERCCTDWSITFKDIPQEDGRHGRTMMITTWKLLGGLNKARRDDWAWETHIDPISRWRVFRQQPGEFCKAWEGDACVQREDGESYVCDGFLGLTSSAYGGIKVIAVDGTDLSQGPRQLSGTWAIFHVNADHVTPIDMSQDLKVNSIVMLFYHCKAFILVEGA